jgi:hypothetical protein
VEPLRRQTAQFGRYYQAVRRQIYYFYNYDFAYKICKPHITFGEPIPYSSIFYKYVL